MALRAQLGRALFADTPLVRGMAGEAFVSQSFQVDGVLAAAHGALMAFRAGGFCRLFRVMDLMAIVAFKWLMRP